LFMPPNIFINIEGSNILYYMKIFGGV
jgi:hypothetical protein